jgi:hypothetical protein
MTRHKRERRTELTIHRFEIGVAETGCAYAHDNIV